ncbi:MAG: short-chain dehydrogenase [Thiomonas sp. 14-64-326]|jgi:NAD(P)-dependent dehydrogenase (short-subunit alcohol dehydrogenase family)|uniref:SDR family NAD(P)-dependent oxidoreductase n=1 Tax=Thiomonas sp. TaxID=2047785 RepID=UPI000BC3BC19|nr:SDR family NAD(P)-dependent oxidoreductase [Thiomonas sp.]OZB76981.1 MAG: short-chain dehydrogenase [Thiomonas sp. 14-64-326]
MQIYQDNIAVITGAAGGIGLALARQAARRNMKLVLTDLDTERLHHAAASLDLPPERLLLHAADVSREADVAALADASFARFGAVHLLCNNAGVGYSRLTTEHSTADWDWVLGVNLMSVVHGIRHFVPRMQRQSEPSHVVNTASAAGLVSSPGMAAYNVSKHGVVTLSETLYAELTEQASQVGVSVLCPAWVPTGINQSARHRQPRFGTEPELTPQSAAYAQRMAQAVQSGKLTPDDIAGITFAAIEHGQFYIVPHRKILQAVELRAQDMVLDRNPTPLTPPAASRPSKAAEASR